jgi:hypothetical protein
MPVVERVHLLAAVRPVTALRPDRVAQQLRRRNHAIAFGATSSSRGLAPQSVQHESARVPEHHPGRVVLEVEQLERVAERPMVGNLCGRHGRLLCMCPLRAERPSAPAPPSGGPVVESASYSRKAPRPRLRVVVVVRKARSAFTTPVSPRGEGAVDAVSSRA